MMKRDIRAVFFDAGYTLLCMQPDQQTIFRSVCDQLQIAIDADKLAEATLKANALFGPRTLPRSPVPFSQQTIDRFWVEYHTIVLRACARRSKDATQAEQVYRRFVAAIEWRVYDEVVPLLSALRAKGIKLGVISNWTGDLEDVLARNSLLGHFDFIIDSARFGYEKPHAPIFVEALRRGGVPPQQALHVGDSPEHDVDGALDCGLHAVLLDRDGRHVGFSRAPRMNTLEPLLQLV